MKRFNLMLLYLLTSFIDRFTEPGGIRGELFSPLNIEGANITNFKGSDWQCMVVEL